jgi:hypothetical protein
MVVGAFRKFTEAIRGDDGRSLVQGYLKPIDTDEIARRLNIDAEAAARGSRDQPSSDLQSLDAVEQKIVQTLESEWTYHGSDLINNLRAYGSRLIAVSVQTELVRLDLLAQNTLARLREAHHRAEAELGPLREMYISYRDELADFRSRNKLARAARNPAKRWTTFGLLIFLIGIEAGLNGFFFAKGSEFGLLGGVGTAIGISFVNVIFAFALGLFPIRWLNHRSFVVKLLGAIVALSGIAAIIALHGFAAHYRDATAAVGEERAFATALQTLRYSPFMLADLTSFYLFGIGLLWAFFAIWKGVTFDDPYPRYGAHYRRAAAAREAYSDEHAYLFEDLEKIKEDTVAQLEDGISKIPRFPQEASLIRSQRDAHLQGFRAYESAVETAVNQLLARYRDANRLHRKISSAPKHFDTPWRLPHSFLSNAPVLKEIADPTTTPLDANAALDALRSLSRSVLGEYETLLLKYPHPTQMPS